MMYIKSIHHHNNIIIFASYFAMYVHITGRYSYSIILSTLKTFDYIHVGKVSGDV